MLRHMNTSEQPTDLSSPLRAGLPVRTSDAYRGVIVGVQFAGRCNVYDVQVTHGTYGLLRSPRVRQYVGAELSRVA